MNEFWIQWIELFFFIDNAFIVMKILKHKNPWPINTIERSQKNQIYLVYLVDVTTLWIMCACAHAQKEQVTLKNKEKSQCLFLFDAT